MILLALAMQAAQPSMITMGNGAETCAIWSAHSGYAREADKQWLAGFVTGLDFGVSIFAQSLFRDEDDPERFVAFVDNYCREHPGDKVAQAAQALYHEMFKRDAASPQG